MMTEYAAGQKQQSKNANQIFVEEPDDDARRTEESTLISHKRTGHEKELSRSAMASREIHIWIYPQIDGDAWGNGRRSKPLQLQTRLPIKIELH